MKVISGTANEPLAESVASALRLSLLPREVFVFPDGERRVRIQESVVDEHVVIVQPTAPPVDTNYLELFLLADAAKRSGAASVTAVVPYLGYQRQDHVFREGEAVSLEVMVKTMESVSIDRLIAVDFHSIKIPEVFTIPVTHLSALPLFARAIKEKGWQMSETQLVTPDMGGIRRIKIISEMLDNMGYTCIVKDRDVDTGHITASGLEGEIKKRMLIVDDMISSGGTIAQAAKVLKEKGAEEIYVYVTHAIFSKEAPELLQSSEVDTVFVTDSVFVPKNKRFVKLEILSISEMVADALQSI
jgi:ribose-phosphate pyrophosphokinase